MVVLTVLSVTIQDFEFISCIDMIILIIIIYNLIRRQNARVSQVHFVCFYRKDIFCFIKS